MSDVTSIAFFISGFLLFASNSNGDCFVWDTLLAKVNTYKCKMVGVKSEWLFYLKVTFEIEWGQVVLNLGTLQNSHEARVSCLDLSADGSALCTGSWDTSLKVSPKSQPSQICLELHGLKAKILFFHLGFES